MSQNAHPSDELHDLLSGRLSEEERNHVQMHLDVCDVCRGDWERMSATRNLLRHFAEHDDVPTNLQQRVASTLDFEQRRRRTRLGWAIAAALVIVIALSVVPRVRRQNFLAAAVADYNAISTRTLPLQQETGDAAQLQQWFDKQLDFSSRVFDLGMMRYRLLGGRVDELAGRRSALFVYRHESGELVVCEMFEAAPGDLPSAPERRHNKGIEFFVYERHGATAVFWQEGNTLCVLVSRMNREDLIALAYAKAMLPG